MQMEQLLDIMTKMNGDVRLFSLVSNQDINELLSLVTTCLCTSDSNYFFKFECFGFACNVIKNSCISVQEKWTLYSFLSSINFTDNSYDKFANEILLCYRKIFFETLEIINSELIEPIENSPNGPVVLTTSQFLSASHAPTRRILDYSFILRKHFNKEIVIINDCGSNCNMYEHIKMKTISNSVLEYSKANTVEYKGVKFSFYQGNKRMLDFLEIERILSMIRAIRPSIVINVGANSITSDLCSYFVKTVTIPCSTRIPISMAENLVVCREIREDDVERISRLEPWQNLITSHFNYIMPSKDDMCIYTRKQFGISELSWVITSAGNRMDEEIKDDFLLAVDAMLDRIEHSVFLLIGRYKQKDRILRIMKNSDRVIIPGAVENASELIKLTNAYIQPKRKGGGRAAFEALFYGIPVTLLPYGDAWDVCGKDFEVADYNEMIERVCRLANDSEFRKDMKEKSSQKGRELEDMESMFKELFMDIDVEFA